VTAAAFTSKDVVDTFTILRLQNTIQWTDYLTDVVAVDDNTVDFMIKEPSNTAPRRLLRDATFARRQPTASGPTRCVRWSTPARPWTTRSGKT
jgi:ABC-type transport system substrate-binding protein